MKIALVFTLLCSQAAQAEFVVWNVGQGLWTTRVHEAHCDHFDLGGEFAPWKLIRERCETKENRAHFSHWDWDHVGFSKNASRRLSSFCVAAAPGGNANRAKTQMIENLEGCEELKNEIRFARKKSDSNGASRIFISGKILIPGDSTAKEEKIWSRDPRLRNVKTLILGHHGSKTSTSNSLLLKLPNLKQAIASARFAKHGHPHRLVTNRLKRKGVATLMTEDWGSIALESEIKNPDSEESGSQ